MFYKVEVGVDNGVPQYRSDMLADVRHGFSTRHGGVSHGEYTKSMNLAFGRGDEDETVIKNFELFARSIGADPAHGLMLGQIHSTNILTVTEKEYGLGVYKKTELCLDGYVSSTPGTLLCVRVADCVPILFADPEAKVIGAVHSGWRGSVGKIGGKCVERMCALGADRSRIRAAIGPCICKSCYEVGEDFIKECLTLLGDELCSKFISRDQNGRLHADLKLLNRLILLEAGLDENNIDVCESCTCCESDEFFSHRYHKEKRGTMCAMIAL